MPRELRLCNLCNANEVECESHFIMDCTYYGRERQLFLEQLSALFPALTSFDTASKLKFILSCGNGDLNISKLICEFINEIYALRNAFLSVSEPEPSTSQDGPVTTRAGRLSLPPLRYPN